MKKILWILLALWAPLTANALNVFACEPEWGALTKEIAGDTATITTGTTAFQDPHHVEARPSLIAATRDADIVICSGADLEIGWLPLLLRRSANPRIQVGGPGYFLASDYVRKLEVPKIVDRSQGDLHPLGNPHIQLNPHNIERVAKALTDRFVELDGANAALYRKNAEDFLARWSDAELEWEDEAADLEGKRLVSYHTSFSYLADWLGLDIVDTLEPKPGVPPSGAQLAKLLEKLTPNPPAAVIRTPYENEKPAIWLSERLGVPQVVLPYTIGGDDKVTDLFTLYSETIRLLKEQLK
jgi:zinc/manganese transport system substrate-binding protein